jgi:hypothetical protein
MSKNDDPPVSLLITPKCHEKIIQYAYAATGEVSGFARMSPNTQVIDRILPLLPQVCSAGETEMEEEFLHEFISTGQSAQANVWWHSHGNIGVMWSAQDETCIKALGQTMSWLVSIVVNKKREQKVRLDFFKPVHITLEAKLYFQYEFPYPEIQKIKNEVAEKVSQQTHVIIDTSHQRSIVRSSYHPTAVEIAELEKFGWTYKGNEIVKMTEKQQADYLLKQTGDDHGNDQQDFGFGG